MVKFPKVTFTPNRSKFDPFQLDIDISVAVGSDGGVVVVPVESVVLVSLHIQYLI
jgi:hypothetical protein